MRILVFSDSHGDVESMEYVVERLHPDLTLHLGDCVTDALKLQKNRSDIKMVFVKGNCDYTNDFDIERVVEVEGHKIFITHGNEYGNACDIRQLFNAAKDHKTSLMLYGHTHIPTLTMISGITLLNPGSICKAKGNGNASFALVEVERDYLTCRIMFTRNL